MTRQKGKNNHCDIVNFIPEDFAPPRALLRRMKVSWPEFVKIFRETPIGTEGELLDILSKAAGISRPEAAYLRVGLYDGHSKRTGQIWLT